MDKKFLFLVLVFLLVFGTFGVAVMYDQQPAKDIRAINQCAPHMPSSFQTSSPKNVPSGESCEINVFVRCEDTSTVTGAKVTLQVTNGTLDSSSPQLTDELGRATFTVTPNGLAEITATVNDSLQIPNKVTCSSQ